MIDGKVFFDQPVKNDKVTYENITNISTGQEIIIQLVVCWTIFTLEILQNACSSFK